MQDTRSTRVKNKFNKTTLIFVISSETITSSYCALQNKLCEHFKTKKLMMTKQSPSIDVQ